MAEAAHLVKRFATSLWPFGPSGNDDQWARSYLLDAEVSLWIKMSPQDRRHSVGVAKRVKEALGDKADRAVIAAALLHDVGKIDARLGTFLRVVATASAAIAGREMAYAWVRSVGITRRVGLYLLHPSIGGDHLAMAGSDKFTETWAREHHLPAEMCTLDPMLANALREADDD